MQDLDEALRLVGESGGRTLLYCKISVIGQGRAGAAAPDSLVLVHTHGDTHKAEVLPQDRLPD